MTSFEYLRSEPNLARLASPKSRMVDSTRASISLCDLVVSLILYRTSVTISAKKYSGSTTTGSIEIADLSLRKL